MKRFFSLLALVIALFGLAALTQLGSIRDAWIEWQKVDVPEISYGEQDARDEEFVPATDETQQPTAEEESIVEQVIVSEEEEDQKTANLPLEYNLAIPFTSQAPFGVWDEVHEETCEEASVLMVAAYFSEEPAGVLDADAVEEELQRIIKFENAFFGYHEDTTAEETALILENYAYLGTELLVNPTVDQIKTAVAAGYPVIVPAAGQQLYNPYFTGDGPVYHMLVVKGYTEDGFITNDPGTRHGQNYTYETGVLMNAIHDWNGGEVELGEKVVIIVKP